jgi:hypothetical protein
MLKKLVTALAAVGALAVATPAVLACPGMEKEKTAGEKAEEAPKTADKTQKQKDEKQKDEKQKDSGSKAKKGADPASVTTL